MALYDRVGTSLATEAEMDSADRSLYGGLAPGTVKNLASIYAGRGMTQSDVEQMMRNLGVQDSVLGSVMQGVTFAGAKPAATQGALQTTTASQPAAAKSPLSFTLPTDWGVAGGAYDEAAEKINYYNTHKITPEMLLAAGQAQSDIDWMLQHGYTVGAGATQGALSGAADTVTSSTGVDTVTSSAGTDTTQGALDTVSRFYDPVLKKQWLIESASDYGTIDTFNKPKGGGGLVYISPRTGEALDRETYLQVANTPEAVSYRAEQERIAAENAKLFRPGNTLVNPLAGVTDFGGDTAISLLSASPAIARALEHKSTFVRPYKVVNGQLQEVTDADITPQDIASNNVYFYIGGATGGPDRQRMAQLYQSKGDQLVPVGDPSFYQGAHPDQAAMDFARIALPIALSFVPGLGTAIGGALGATGAAAGAIGSGVLSFGTQLAMGADPLQALKGAALSAAGGYLGGQVSSMLPTEVAGIGKNVITQLVTTGKLDPAALATSVGTSFATDALAAETGMDKATAGKLVTAGLQAFQGNELAALTSLAQAGISSGLAGTGVSAQSPQDRAAFLEANASPQGVGALSPIAAEDEQIAIQQRVNKANQAIADYAGPGNDLSREGLVSQLQSFGLTADQAEDYAIQADQRINMNRVGADVMNRYSKIDPEFGTPQLDRDIAWAEMVAAGFTSDRANEILNGIDAQNAIKLENKLSVQSAYNNLTKGTGTEEQLRSAMTSAGYTDNEINNLVTKGLGILEGSKLTAGEQAQERVSQLPDVRAEIAAKPTFSEAYRLARDTYGSGATFTWQGKSYSTDTFQENPALGLVPVAGSGRGQAAGKTAEQEAALLATAEELKRIDPVARASLLDSASVDYGAVSPEGNAQGLTQTAADKLVQSVIPVNAIKTAFGMTTEAAGNTLKAFGTIGESLGFNTAQMSDYGRKLENIAQELYPQALRTSESEVKNRFASANSAADIGRALKDSILNNPGAVAKMIGVEGLQELPNIALALATGGTSALIRYGGMLAGLGLDVVESAGLQGAQKVDEGLAKGLTRAQAVKSAVDDMKAAGAVTAVMTAAADKVPFGGTIAKTMIKGSAGEGIEEYVIARATGQDHMSALRQAAFGALIGGPTEASLQGAGNLTNVTINGDTMIGTYADGTKVSISEPAGATDLKIDIIKPTDTSVNVSNALTADLSSGADLTTSINSVVSNNITADLSGTIDSTVKSVIDNGVDLSQGVTNLTSAAVANTGDTTSVINNVVSSLASNGTDLNANAGSIVTGAVSGGASVTNAVDTTLKAVTANGGNVADAAASIITSVSASGDTAQVANATTAVVNAAITSGSNVTATTSNAVDAALAASGGSTDAVTQVVGGVASQGNNDATAAAVSSAVTTTGDTSAAVNAALTNGGDASAVLSTASNAAITAGTDTNTAVTNTLTSALNNNVDTTTAVNSTVKGALDAGADVSQVVNSAITTAVTNNVDTVSAVTNTVTAALNNNVDVTAVVDSAITTAVTNNVDTASAITNTVTAALNNNADVSAVVDSAIKTSLDNGVDTAAAVTSVVTAAINNNADISQVVSTVISTAVNNNADTNAAIDSAIKTVINAGADVNAAIDSVITTSLDTGGNTSSVITSTVNTAISSGADVSAVVASTIDASIKAGGDVTATVDTTIKSALDNGGDAASVIDSSVKAGLNAGSDASVVIDTAITAGIANGADTSLVIDSAVTTAIANGADTSAVVDSAVKAAVDAGTDSTSAIDSALTAVANAGGDVAQAVGSAVDASLAAGADTSQTLIAATSTAITNGGDASTVVSNVVNSAVENGASLADATASSVATAIVSGADANAVIQTLTNSNSNLAVESGSNGDVTTVLASDGTSNTQVTMDAGSQTVTTTTTDTTTGETKQVTIQGDTTTTVSTDNSGVTTSVTVDESTGVKTEITSDAGSVTSITTDTTGSTTEVKSDVDTGVVTQIVSNPDRDQIVTTTWSADNTVTVTIKSGDGPETTETLTADVAPVKPKLDPIAAVVPVQAAQATKTTTPKAAAPKASFKLPSAAASGFGLSMPMASSDYDLGVLKSSGDTRLKNPLEALMERVEQMNQIDPMLAAVMSQRLGIQPQQAPTFTYGQETSIDDILGLREPKKPEMEEALYAEGGYVEPLRAKGGAMNLQFMNRGGVLPGGREDFKDGKHVAGDGDGQSDDIPAWLADGEFVFPADVVSALGNGSTKAGTDKLYKMMHEIRARARSTKVKDLPPPAHKSPLDYIKKGK